MAVISSLLTAVVAFGIGYAMAKEYYNPHIDYEKSDTRKGCNYQRITPENM